MKSIKYVIKQIGFKNFQIKNKSFIPIVHRNISNLTNTKNKIDNSEKYTTYSYLNSNQNEQSQEKVNLNESKSLDTNKVQYLLKYVVAPIVTLPITIHFGLSFFDQIVNSKFTHYSFQLLLKHSFVLGCVNTGLLTGLKISEENQNKQADLYKTVTTNIAVLTASFAAMNTLVFYPVSFLAFNSIYLSLLMANYHMAKSLKDLLPQYSYIISKILLLVMGVMLIIVNVNYEEYQKKVAEQSKFEDVVKFYELSSDKEFKKVMLKFEEFLNEIDVKVEKIKE